MKIREEIIYDKSTKTNIGYENYGDADTIKRNGHKKIAKEALVFMVNIVNHRSKIPLAYFLTSGVSEITYCH